MPHPVGLNPQRDVQGVLRHILKEIRAVVAGRAVQVRGPDAFHGLEKGALIAAAFEVVAAGEHEMLEEMSETGLARFFVFGANMIPQIDRHNRRFVVFMNDQRQPVGQHKFLEGNLDLRIVGCRPGGRQQ